MISKRRMRRSLPHPRLSLGANQLLLILLLLPVFPARPSKLSQPAGQSDPPGLPDCQVLLDQYGTDGAFLQSLADPVFSSQDSLAGQLNIVSALDRCLSLTTGAGATGTFSNLPFLTRLFLIFTGDEAKISGESTQFLIDPQKSKDPAIVKLREEIGIPAPPGWIYLRFYGDREAMPDLIRKAFQNPQVEGVTILSRYIAILNDSGSTWEERALQDQTLPDTVSHELVHAYINSSITQQARLEPGNFPRWFEEGLASYISESPRPNSIITTNGTIRETAPEDYQYFTQIFEYLEDRMGKDVLAENIRLAVQTNDAGQLYRNLGIQDDRWLYEAVDAWNRRRIEQRFILGLAGMGIILLWLYSLLPELVCACGYKGRKRDFPMGNCPNCGRPVAGARKEPQWKPGDTFFPDCQVCGRRFWPWQRTEIQIHKRWVRAWLENPTENQPPIAHYVYRICENCTQESQSIGENYQKQVDAQVQAIQKAWRPVFHEWLADAPILPATIANGEGYPVEALIDELILAALAPYNDEWMTIRPVFRFIYPRTLSSKNLSVFLPGLGYQKVIISTQKNQVGSIFSKGKDIISILWEAVND